MKLFLVKVVIFLIIVSVIAIALEKLIDRGLKHSSSENYKEWNDIIYSRINADLIIQGSSRAWQQISPYVLDSTFNVNSYNLGLDGWQFHMQYYRFLLYLKYNKKPKYIIQNVDHSTFIKIPDLYYYTQFLPYLDDDIIKKAVSSYNGLNWKDSYIPLYKYHSNYKLVFKSLLNNLPKSSSPDNGKYKGFQAQQLHWDSTFSQFKKANPNGWRIIPNKEAQNNFKSFLDICKSENIQVIFVYTPEYIEIQKLLLNRDSLTNILRGYASKYNIPFLDYSNDSLCLDTINFFNSQHLNMRGVKKFNLKFATDLKRIIKIEPSKGKLLK